MPNFSQIKRVSDGEALLRAATPPFVAVNALYMAGDHLQNGLGWGGPTPPPGQEDEAIAQLARVWTPAPVVNECLENHVSGIAGREMAFEIVLSKPPPQLEEGTASPPDPNEKRRDEINAALGQWFDQNESLATIQEWASRLRWAGRGTLRLFIPPDAMVQDANGNYRLPPEVDSPEKALAYICLEAPNVEAAMVYTDPKSRRKCGLFRYNETPEPFDSLVPVMVKRRLEKVFVADADESNRGEGRPAIKKGQTVLQVLEPAETAAVNNGVITVNPLQLVDSDRVIMEVVFPCGGNSLIYESRLPLLFTDPVKRLQRALNLLNTLLAINATYAGFRSRDYFNATQPEIEEGGESEVASGPARAMFWYSQPYRVKKDDGTEGETKYFPPTLVTTEPVESGPLLELKSDYERQLRRAFRQEHTMNDGPQVSAVALIQRRAAFLISLLGTKPAVEDGMTWLQSTVWCFALYLCGKKDEIAEFQENFRATCTAKPYTGPLAPDEIRVILEMVKARLMPREVAAGLIGTEDLDAFIAAINEQDKNDPDMILLRSQIYAELRGAGEGKKASAAIAGMSEEQVTLLTTDYEGTPTP
ncbi:MAG: hypothetical protein KY445_16705 [Armatimonadetes bacterium]|nr:hypothetical protein [Armatimonadota bacterium]